MYKIAAKQIFIDGELKEGYALEIKNGTIEHILSNELVADETVGMYLIPGLIDTHIHGFAGVEAADGSVEQLIHMSQSLAENGVTTFLPTLQTESPENIERALKNLTEARKRNIGAKMRGIFLEGPFLAPKFKGAQNGEYLRKPSIELLKKWQEIAEGSISKIAIAPELEGAAELIEYAVEQGITVAFGHSDATAMQTKFAVEKGAHVMIHTFNAMRGLHHREPGLLGIGLTDNRVYAEMTCDGHHIHPLIADLIIRSKGRDKTVLITDGTLASGMPDGSYIRSGVPVWLKEGAVRTEDGSLAGSSLSLIQAVRNVVSWGIADLDTAVRMATVNAAQSIGWEEGGKLEVGSPADFIILDENLNVLATYIDGQKI